MQKITNVKRKKKYYENESELMCEKENECKQREYGGVARSAVSEIRKLVNPSGCKTAS